MSASPLISAGIGPVGILYNTSRDRGRPLNNAELAEIATYFTLGCAPDALSVGPEREKAEEKTVGDFYSAAARKTKRSSNPLILRIFA
jgi:hypothetical protein